MLTRHGIGAVTLSLLLVLSGCAAPADEPSLAEGGAGAVSNTSDIASPDANFSDPDDDPLGWEEGYWYNESLRIDQSDGLSDAELDRYMARSMARVEYLRHEEFTENVSVDVLTRTEYRQRSANRSANQSAEAAAFDEWNNQVWEALFVTGEENDSQEAISGTQGSSVAGFYSPRNDAITIITNSPDSPTIDNATLVHELTHALQDQHYDLTSEKYSAETQDGELAVDGAIEGDAKYVELRYASMCGGEWACVPTPTAEGGSGGSGGSINYGIFLTIFQPYSDGPVYVHDVLERGGWDALDEMMRNPPASTEQTIHSTDEEPVPISFRSRATNGWSTFSEQGQGGSDTLGEASIFTMFWYQARTANADTVPVRDISETESRYDTYNYDAVPSNGWANDRLFPYEKSTGSGEEYGYVWVTEWDTEGDAREFRDAYLNILAAHDAAKQGQNTWVIEDGPFADAFRVRIDGTRVVVVNGPTVEDVNDIRPRN
ncbi:hypothetical protein C474_03365 [Halogeometricum pallidum JCM 14848]|uniref:Lipoprotein n=1 Tax=Halogeometricum pallidum JCM 14848 TaxID=1227487 RepID=M0DEQ1_HALPD|nr:Hvo_1808 family surface protein [Halogeometricum pallidum]ELZ33966.1 hypothetical protein C474_03365 [Halogeometricum pallidum JCM 14848]